MAAKTTDISIRKHIQTLTPRESKQFGKTIELRNGWDDIKLSVMRDLINQKFSDKNPELVELLQNTGDQHIQEGNWWCDFYWGVSIRKDRTAGKGENNLGKLIMERRSVLQVVSS
jgi:predicted NAD-dependent protein-ADP-ribosyltransferase YbiA (DUF1768 family)